MKYLFGSWLKPRSFRWHHRCKSFCSPMSYQWRHKIKWVKLCVGCITSNVSNNVYFNLTTMKKDWYFSAVIPSLFPKVWTKLTLIAFPSLLVLARNMKCHYYVKRSFRWHHCLRIRITGTFIKDYENVAQFFFFLIYVYTINIFSESIRTERWNQIFLIG